MDRGEEGGGRGEVERREEEEGEERKGRRYSIMDLYIHYAVLEEEPLPVCHTRLAPTSEVSPPAHTASQEPEEEHLQ